VRCGYKEISVFPTDSFLYALPSFALRPTPSHQSVNTAAFMTRFIAECHLRYKFITHLNERSNAMITVTVNDITSNTDRDATPCPHQLSLHATAA